MTGVVEEILRRLRSGLRARRPRQTVSGEESSRAIARPALRGVLVARAVVILAAAPLLAGVLAACGSSSAAVTDGSAGAVSVVAAENEYGSVAAQIGGRYVHVVSVESNPNTDPHTYEVSPNVASEVSGAGLVIQNGVGYDNYMGKIESASPNPKRKVIDVQRLLGLPDSTPNPHLWYAPRTMPAAARAMADDFAALDPTHAAYFRQNLARFDASLKPWYAAIAAFRARYGGSAVATTEPVADYLLQAMGIDNLTPFVFQADIMNGTDPSPQNVALENGFFSQRKVKVFAYNQQVTGALTKSFLETSRKAGIPVVGVYETMPTPGYTYQTWMMAEVAALEKALTNKVSTESLQKGR
ncbi:MAG: zinc ABC transporter substrate-binding protein [Acetobacteraceae bacterium]|nr:zinc ABC transporter substrate-binding protein [Acetobacteraceae bacterium]